MSNPAEQALVNLVASGQLDKMMLEIRDGILTKEVVAAFRLPIPVQQLAKITKLFPGNHMRMTQRGEWLLLIDSRLS